MKPRNPQARSLTSKLFKPRVVKPKKGKGSYTRKPHNGGKHAEVSVQTGHN